MRRALGVIVVLTASTLTTFPAAATPPTKPSASAPSSVAPRPRPGPPVPGVRQPKPVVTPDCATLKAQRYALARQGHRTALCLGRGRLPKGWTLAKALAVPVAKAPAAKAPRARRPDGLEPEPPGVAIPAWCNDGLAGGWDQWDPTWMSGWAWLDRYHVCFNRDPPRLFLRPGFRGSGAWLGPGWARGRPVAGVMTSPWRSTGHRWGAAASVTQAAAGPGAGWVQRRWWPRTSGWERHAAQPVQREEELVRPGPAGG